MGTQADLSKEDQLQLTAPLQPAEEAQSGLIGGDLAESEADNVANSTATVKVVLVPEGHVMTVTFAIGLRIEELKDHLASELRVPPEVLQLTLDGRVVDEQRRLMEHGVRPHSSIRMEVSSTDPCSHSLRPLRPAEHDSMPDVITVQVQREEGVFEEVVVEIELSCHKKPFLGGYRHRLTGVEYHHAAVQTLPKRRPDRGVVIFSRDTQTAEMKCQMQQCPVNACTQMTGSSCFIPSLNDKLLTPGKYITAEEIHDRRLKAVICLQTFARRWLAQQAVERLRGARRRRLVWLEMQKERLQKEKNEQLRDRRERWMNPQRKEDFNLLYHTLEKWRKDEEQQINATLRGAERKAALCSLLEQETQLIASIERHRIHVHADNHDKIIKDFLDRSAAPHRWRAASGRLLEMDTPHILLARELRDLYNNISMEPVDREQRQHFLMTLKDTVKKQDCQLTRDIVDLVNQEVDLMSREVRSCNLQGLRKRICVLFLQYIKTPTFNPNVAKLLKVPQDLSKLKNDIFRCRGCQRYLRSADFKGLQNAWCRNCTGTDNIARSRDELSLYKSILMRLREDEQLLGTDAKIPFLLQVEDMRYLTETVWASRSALSGSSDLYNLVFSRWERQKDWSPWNCILLSKEETSAHSEVEDVHQVYQTTLICWIERRHMMARQHFSHIPKMAKHLGSELAAVLGNQSVSKAITKETGSTSH
ncbi:IQ and ubiquitin-like domain-containing protein [Austrofundulus limnaeus]|uniref:IQ and ubiquitin-like domain-containing protein n=1 Tax=Austrofundulus limnaeus TaxID=52670 RepID=A0A2I4B6N7_AUSLI|nr:PREDICTED: IQ and ubiquitin-like domain-containing protein [Austrofundulus limnaeus]